MNVDSVWNVGPKPTYSAYVSLEGAVLTVPDWVKLANKQLDSLPQEADPSLIADLLEKAIEILEVGGWTRGTMMEQTMHCSMGAIGAARHALLQQGIREDHMYLSAAKAICDALPEGSVLIPGDWERSVIHWNDRLAEGPEEVIEVFKQAVKELRNRAVPA